MQFLMTPRRFVWTWVLSVLGLLLAIALLGSCSTISPPPVKKPQPAGEIKLVVLSEQEQMSLAVRLDVACKMPNGDLVTYIGSGAIVSRTRVLTAYHVVDCIDEAKKVTGTLLSVYASRGEGEPRRAMNVELAIHNADVARLKLVDDAPRFPHVTQHVARPPFPFGDVCIATLYPKRAHKCGYMRPMVHELPGDLEHSADTIRGNSGSGIYDAQGNLVAIVTHFMSMFGVPLGGRATSLYPRRWIVPRWETFP